MDASDANPAVDAKSTVDGDQIVRMRDGQIVSLRVLRRLWEIEARGGSFVIVDNGFDVEPDSTLTATDRAFILRHLDEAIRIVHLQEADDSHLYEA